LRAEKIDEPLEHIPRILEKCKKEYLQKIYKITEWTDPEDFVGQLAVSYGKLLKVNKMILIKFILDKIRDKN
jgi:nuclear GTP-binding protein